MDTSLDRRRENAYKSAHKGETLRTRSATTMQGAGAMRHDASVRSTPPCARRDCHAIV
jgi:hypothetical protein